MSDEHPPRYVIPRRMLNGQRWIRPGEWLIDVNGIVGRWKDNHGNEFVRVGLSMGCVKDTWYDRETMPNMNRPPKALI